MHPLPPNDENMTRAAEIIRSGGLVSFPTETVYGLGADAMNPVAVARIFEAKQRPFFDPLIVHVAEMDELHAVAECSDPRIATLAERFWPGPLTLVLPRRERVPDIVTSGLDTVAVRMPRHDVALRLIREAGTPVAAPSANPFGYISPTCADHVARQLGDRVDMILDGGPCEVGVESTIIHLGESQAVLLRPGGLAPELVEEITGPLLRQPSAGNRPVAPGALPFHYAPHTPLRILSQADIPPPGDSKTGFIVFSSPLPQMKDNPVEILSPSGDLRQAAANLFAALHKLDGMGLDVIYAQPVPERGLGVAIMDRLRKAEKRCAR